MSFDGNYRRKLWQAWQGDAPAILREIVAQADLVFADHRDISVILGDEFTQPAITERNLAAAQAALRRLSAACSAWSPPCARSTASTTTSLSAMAITRGGQVDLAPTIRMTGIVDRIGAGDAFAAGVLHGELTGLDDRRRPALRPRLRPASSIPCPAIS